MEENSTNKEKFQTTISLKPRLNWFYKTICWCSGARLYLLEKCPADYNKFFGIGVIVIMTGVMASLSGGYALYTVFNNYLIAICFGIIWGMMIFSLDWYIVSSLKKERNIGREFLFASPRLILALFIAVVISKPLELKLFEKEINQEILTIQRENSLAYNSLVESEFEEIKKIENQNEQLLADIKTKENQRERLFVMIIEEAEGRSVTNKVGRGPVYKEKKTEFDQIQNDLVDLKERNYTQIDKNELRIEDLKIKKTDQISQGAVVNKEYGGFLTRLDAMDRLTNKNQTVKIANWFIILLFVFFESAPMIVKLLSKRGPYDILFNSEEKANTLVATEQFARVDISKSEIIELNEQLTKYRFQLIQESEKKYIKKVFETKYELDELKIEKWREQELKKIKENIDKVVGPIDKLTNSENRIYT